MLNWSAGTTSRKIREKEEKIWHIGHCLSIKKNFFNHCKSFERKELSDWIKFLLLISIMHVLERKLLKSNLHNVYYNILKTSKFTLENKKSVKFFITQILVRNLGIMDQKINTAHHIQLKLTWSRAITPKIKCTKNPLVLAKFPEKFQFFNIMMESLLHDVTKD